MSIALAGALAAALVACVLVALLDPGYVVRRWERRHERRQISKRSVR